MPLTTYCHQQSKTPQKSAKKGSESAKKASLYGKSTQRLNKTKKVSKNLFKAQVATELFKASTTPTKTPNRIKNERTPQPKRTPGTASRSRREIDFMTYLDESFLVSPMNKQQQLSNQNSRGQTLRLRTKKQTKAAKSKHRKQVKVKKTPRKRTVGVAKMLPRTPAKEPVAQPPVKNASKGQGQTDQKNRQGLMQFFADAGRVVACAAPVLFALLKTRKIAMA